MYVKGCEVYVFYCIIQDKFFKAKGIGLCSMCPTKFKIDFDFEFCTNRLSVKLNTEI